MNEGIVPVPCPRCEEADLTSVVTAPFARGFLIAYQSGSKKIIGCKHCVAKGLRGEAGMSLLIGWFSVTALIANLFFIPWNFFRSFFVKEDHLAVTGFLDEIGVPRPGLEYRLQEAFYQAGASLIMADGKIEDEEVSVAIALGKNMLPEFDEHEFTKVLNKTKTVLNLDYMSSIFNTYLTESGQGMIIHYLLGIAIADGDFAKSEDKMIEKLAVKMGYSKKQYRSIRAELLD